MKIAFYDIIFLFQCGCMLASAIFSIKLIGNKRIPPYMNKFYWYSFVAGVLAIFDLLRNYFNIINKNTYVFFDSILLLFHFIFLSLFIYRVLPKRSNSEYFKLLIIFFLLGILFCMFANDLTGPQSTAYTFTNFGLVIFCCIYYLQLFEDMPTINLLKEPSFWVINGVFFCMCATIPITSLTRYLFNNISRELYFSIESIGAFAYGVMHLFFIKAYLCSTNQPKA
jgi:hypothetical protein